MSQNPTSEKSRLILAIKEERISVAPETKVDVHIGIINQGTNADYFNILAQGVPAEWISIDTPAVHLGAGQARQVILSIQSPALQRGRVGEYPLDVSAISQSDPSHMVTAHSLVTVAAFQSGGRIGVMLGSIYFSVVPGSTVAIPVLLQNHGLKADVFELNVEGIPANWISTNVIFTPLEPSKSHEIEFSIQVPRSPDAGVGRRPFKIMVTSQDYPEQKAEVECILTISAFSKFSATLQPGMLQAERVGQVAIHNEGNTEDTYRLDFQNPANALLFEKGVQVSRTTTKPEGPKIETAYVEISQDEAIRINAGGQAIYPFRSRLRSRPLIGNVKTYPFVTKVRSAENTMVEIPGETNQGGFIPPWVALAVVLGPLVACLLLLIPFNNIQASASATQTAAFIQTQVVIMQTGVPAQMTATAVAAAQTQAGATQTQAAATQTALPGLLTGTAVAGTETQVTVAQTALPGLLTGTAVAATETQVTIAQTGIPAQLTAAAVTAAQTQAARGPTPTPAPTYTPLPTNTPLATNTAIASPTSTPPFPALQGILLFESNRDGNPEIYAMNLASQSTLRLTNDPANDMQPALAPDSMRVAYVSNQNGNNEIYVTGLDRRPSVNLTNNPGDDEHPTWSPDGNWIAFSSNRDGNQEIYVMRSDGSQAHNLTSNTASDFAPSWFSVPGFLGLTSEDWIAFTSTRDGNQEIYRVRPDGTGLTNLTKNPANDYSPAGAVGRGLVAFVSDRDGNPEIYTMTADGDLQTNLTNSFSQDLDPSFDPSGKWIAFSSDRDGNLEVYVVELATGKTYNLTRNPAQDGAPGW